MSPFSFASPVEKSFWLGKSPQERQQWSRDFYICHPAVQVIFDHCREKLEQCERADRHDAMLVLGGSGSGKTALCDQLNAYAEAQFGQQQPDRTICPSLRLTIPDPCTPLEFAVAILHGLGDPRPRGRRHKAETIQAAALLLRECDVRLVLVDNTQDIPARRAARGVELVGARLREFIDCSKALWVFLGTDDALKVVNSDPQLIKRICYRGRLPYFGISDERTQKNFRRLLRKVDRWLPLAEPSCLCDPKLAGPIHIATEGIFDRIVQLVDRGWVEACDAGRETMVPNDLDRSFAYIYGPEWAHASPFKEGFVVRRLRDPGDPFEVLRGGS